MRITILLSFLFCVTILHASKPAVPDSLAVAKLYSTSWKPAAQYKPSGLFHRLKKVPLPGVTRITIYQNEFHTATSTGVYQVCTSRHRNGNEFWLDCKQMDQLIYRVISIEGDLLIMDVLSKPFGKTEYIRTSRNHYARVRD